MRQAGGLARKTAQSAFRHWTKGEDRSPVSEADIAVNDLLHQRLKALVPDAGWLSEETEGSPGATNALIWIVDPIDGTRAFISGRADWSISAALVEDGRPLVAALYAPVSEEIFLAARGAGATLNGAPMKTNDGNGLRGAKIAGPKRYLDTFSTLAEGTIACRKSTRSPCESRASRKGPWTLLSPRGAATIGTLQPPTFWCTKPAAR